MKCTVCDRCKKIIENPKQLRILTSAKPIKPPPSKLYSPTDPMFNEISWKCDLCVKCSEELEKQIFPERYAPIEKPPINPDNPEGEGEGEGENPGGETGGDSGETGGTGNEGESSGGEGGNENEEGA